MYHLTTEAAFDSAHFLSGHKGKCQNLHGHRWRISAQLSGEVLQQTGDSVGMLMDFSDFKRGVRDLAESLDHCLIMEENSLRSETLDALLLEGFSIVTLPFRPTAENLAKYLFDRLRAQGFALSSITIYETPDNCAVYEAPLL